MDNNIAVSMRHITKAFGTKVVANKDVSMDIREGEISLTSLYMEIEKSKAAAKGIALEDADIEVPRRFDFRMFVPKKN